MQFSPLTHKDIAFVRALGERYSRPAMASPEASTNDHTPLSGRHQSQGNSRKGKTHIESKVHHFRPV